jgi:hypothetical protein
LQASIRCDDQVMRHQIFIDQHNLNRAPRFKYGMS